MLYEYAAGILFCRYSHPPTPKGPLQVIPVIYIHYKLSEAERILD